MSQDWDFSKGKRRGQHSNISIYMRENKPIEGKDDTLKCSICNKRIKGKQRTKQMRKHLKEHAEEDVEDLSVEEVKDLIQEYFLEHFDVDWNPDELDKLIQERQTP